MCCFGFAHHGCGHVHKWFIRCFEAKRLNTSQCALKAFPSWEYPERHSCPECRAERSADTDKILRSQGRKVIKLEKPLKMEDASSTQPFPIAPIRHAPMTSQLPPQRNNSIAGNLARLQVAPTPQTATPTQDLSKFTPAAADLAAWIAPSVRYQQAATNHLPSSPPLDPAPESSSTLSSDIFPFQSSPPPNSEAPSPYPVFTTKPTKDAEYSDAEFEALLRSQL